MSSRPMMYTLTGRRPRRTGPVLNVHSEYSVGSAELASPDMGSASDCPPHPDPVCSQPFDPSPYEPTRWYDAALVAAQPGPVVAANVAGAAFLVACRCPLPCPDPDPVPVPVPALGLGVVGGCGSRGGGGGWWGGGARCGRRGRARRGRSAARRRWG